MERPRGRKRLSKQNRAFILLLTAVVAVVVLEFAMAENSSGRYGPYRSRVSLVSFLPFTSSSSFSSSAASSSSSARSGSFISSSLVLPSAVSSDAREDTSFQKENTPALAVWKGCKVHLPRLFEKLREWKWTIQDESVQSDISCKSDGTIKIGNRAASTLRGCKPNGQCINHDYEAGFGCSTLGFLPMQFNLERKRECQMLVHALSTNQSIAQSKFLVSGTSTKEAGHSRIESAQDVSRLLAKKCNHPSVKSLVVTLLDASKEPVRIDERDLFLRTWVLVTASPSLQTHLRIGPGLLTCPESKNPLRPCESRVLPLKSIVKRFQNAGDFLSAQFEPRVEEASRYIAESLMDQRTGKEEQAWQFFALDWRVYQNGSVVLFDVRQVFNGEDLDPSVMGKQAWDGAMRILSGARVQRQWKQVRPVTRYNPCKAMQVFIK